ncbi:MAG TPA: hypothetical protein VJU18_11525 [Vicinamibacteria bacterium]|nr:hypothetical protein [Vicinamibacteria bacterium]
MSTVPVAPPASAAAPARRRPALGGWLRRQFVQPEPVFSAIEVRADSLGVLRLTRGAGAPTVAAATSVELPAGCLRLSMTEPNLEAPQVFRERLASALERAGVGPGRVALVLPDPLVRLTLLPPGEELPRGRAQRDELLRFKLRKSVPFEIREAHLACLPDRAGTGGTVVAAIFRPVLGGYEDLCRSLGLEPGLVQVSALALLSAASETDDQDWLLVNWEPGYLTLALVRRGWPVLVRTLTGASTLDPAEVSREVATTLLYHRERLGGAALGRVLLRSGVHPVAEVTPILAETLGFAPTPYDAWGRIEHGELGPAGHALAGAAACLLGDPS